MAPTEEDYIPKSVEDVGLDRARIDRHHKIELPQQPHHERIDSIEAEENDDRPDELDPTRSSTHPHLSALNNRRHSAASKLKKALHIKTEEDAPEPNSESSVLAKPADEQADFSMKHAAKRAKGELHKDNLKEYVQHPVDTVKDKVSTQGSRQVAENIAAREVPQEQERDIINAHDAVQGAQTETEKLLAIEDLERLLKERQTTFVRWTLDRHVAKVRILPRDTFQKKPRSEFQQKDAQGQLVTDWNAYAHHLLMFYVQQYGGQYIGYGSNPPPPSKNNIIPNIERLLIASAPFQQIFMTIRRVYRWEDRNETLKYLAIYVVLWYLNLILAGILSAVVYYVIERKVHGNSIEDLRKDIQHTDDAHQTALSLAEFIEKRGDEYWADDAIKALGPWLMVQLADLANAFEAVRNFYEWRVPHRTMISLSILVSFILIITITPLWLLVKSAGFGFGIMFFVAWPIATNYPEYRLLTSPPKRIFWNIPTHAEWAIKSLQAEGSRYQLEDSVDNPSATSNRDRRTSYNHHKFGLYTAHHKDSKGQLTITPSSVRFEGKRGVLFDLPYNEINNLEKVNRRVGQNIPKPKRDTGKDLRIISRTGEEWLLENMDQRDMAFSQIIGFSDTTWQVVW